MSSDIIKFQEILKTHQQILYLHKRSLFLIIITFQLNYLLTLKQVKL